MEERCQIRPASRLDRVLLGTVFVSLPLAQTFPVPGVSVADVVLAAASAVVATQLLSKRPRPTAPVWLLPAALLIGWSIVGALVLPRAAVLPFSEVELAKSLAKLIFYVSAASLVAVLVGRVAPAIWTGLLLGSVATHALIGLYVYIAMLTPWGLPFHFLWTHSQGTEISAYAMLPDGGTFLRLRGMAAEPSYCGYYLVLGLTTCWLAWPQRRPGWREVTSGLAAVLTLSLSAFALASVTVPVMLLRHPRRAPALLGAAVVCTVLLLAAFLAPPIARAARLGLIERPVGIATGTLSRTNLMRLNGSYAAALLMVGRSPVFGVGLGNYDVAIAGVLPQLDPTDGVWVDRQVWSIPAYVLAALGWPGLAVLLLLFASCWRRDWAAGLVLIAAAVADGTFLGSPFWVFLVLLFQPVLQELPQP